MWLLPPAFAVSREPLLLLLLLLLLLMLTLGDHGSDEEESNPGIEE